MNIRRIAAITAAGAVVAGGAGVAIGAVSNGKKAEQEVLADAAKRLDTTPQKLRDALAAAQNAQLDRAVKAGEITQEQADRIKAARKASGSVLGGPGMRGPGGPGHHRGGMGGPGPRRGPGIPIHEVVAKALGVSAQELHERLHDGKSIADVAKAEGKSLDSVKDAVRAAVKAQLDKQVKAKRITQAQADERLEHLEEHLARFDQSGGGFRGPGGPGGPRGPHGHGGPPPGGDPAP